MDFVNKTVQNFLIDYCEYLPPEIPVLNKPPSAAEFLNNHVVPNSPFIIKPLDKGLYPTAVQDLNYAHNMMLLMNGRDVTVAVTPDGKADSIVDDKFMVPEERTMNFIDYLNLYANPQSSHVLYVQKQNNNLIEEFSPFLSVLGKDIPWATEAFGSPPEAANIWMGDHFSFTSMHKDHYENIYFVVAGAKKFRLFPPISIAWMPYRTCPKFQWYFDNCWRKKDLNEEVSWIKPDLIPETREKFAMFLNTKSYNVTVSAGEALYLPAMWFHEVQQEDRTIAVNYWYDMTYEMKFPYFHLVEALTKLPFPRKDAANDTQTELEDQLIRDIMPQMTSKGFKKKDSSKKKF